MIVHRRYRRDRQRASLCRQCALNALVQLVMIPGIPVLVVSDLRDRLSQSGDRRIPMAGGAISSEPDERGTA
jgi:hypothetical protein